MSAQVFPPLPPPPPLPQELAPPAPEQIPYPPVLEVPGPIDFFPYFETEIPQLPPLEFLIFDIPDMVDFPQWDELEPQVPVQQPEIPPLHPDVVPDTQMFELPAPPVLFPAPIAIYAPVPRVYQFPQAEFMDEVIDHHQIKKTHTQPCKSWGVTDFATLLLLYRAR